MFEPLVRQLFEDSYTTFPATAPCTAEKRQRDNCSRFLAPRLARGETPENDLVNSGLPSGTARRHHARCHVICCYENEADYDRTMSDRKRRREKSIGLERKSSDLRLDGEIWVTYL